MNKRFSPRVMVIAAGTMLSVCGVAQAQQLINYSGSTLLGSLLRNSQALCNDYIGVSTANPAPGTNLVDLGVWSQNYRGSGSINGLDELLIYGVPSFVQVADNRTAGNMTPLNSLLITDGWYNKVQYVTATGTTGAYSAAHPGGAPFLASTSGADRSITTSISGGITMDVAFIDVPAIWGIEKGTSADAAANRKPNVSGYGTNPKLSVARDGSTTGPNAGFTNALSTLQGRNLADFPGRNATDPMAPNYEPFNTNTAFEFPLALAPIAPVYNPGTGLTKATASDLRHLFATGRMPSGENLVAVTRDIGSGTRNGFCNYLNLDPSFGIGENIGRQNALAVNDQLGVDFIPTNKGGTPDMLRTLRNCRLGVGYAGAETAVSGSNPSTWILPSGGAALDIVNTFFDDFYTQSEIDAIKSANGGVIPDSYYKRPVRANVLLNNRDGWPMSGQAHIVTIGDPGAEPTGVRTAVVPNNGGLNNGNPAMVDKSAARFVNNILRSVDGFTSGDSTNLATPAQFIATSFALMAASTNVIDSATLDPLSRVSNPLNPNPEGSPTFAQMWAINNSVFNNAAYTATQNLAGPTPTRNAGTYTDHHGAAGDPTYVTQGTTGSNGSNVGYAANPSQNGEPVMNRNKIAFDFNGDGVRSLADAPDMLAAWRQRNAGPGGIGANDGPAWVAPTGTAGNGANAIIEVLGDFDGDGSFTAADVRAWADGLALNAQGKLDRKAGFIAVDNASLGAGGPLNFFGTTLATGKPYTAGASRADIAGPSGKVAPGWAPVGSDGAINALDIDYIYSQIRAVGITNPWTSASSADWSDITQAAKFDLSADINGDLKVDKHDIEEILTILGTRMGDVNLDGVVNATDRAIINSHLGQTGLGWAGGDLNGDGIVDAADLALACPADINGSGTVTVQDLFDFLGFWFANDPRADINGSGTISVQDIFDFLGFWFAGPC